MSKTSEEEDHRYHLNTCHLIPSKIEYTGRASVEAYFRPQRLLDVKEESYFHAAQFRGRALLAAESGPAHGYLLEVDPLSRSLHVNSTFDRIFEWAHESEPSLVHDNNKNSRVQTALQWCDLAHNALHSPLPLLEEEQENKGPSEKVMEQ